MHLILTTPPLPTVPRPQRQFRHPGTHLSAIIKDLCVTLEPDRFSGEDSGKDGRDEFYFDLEENPKIWLGQSVDQYLAECLIKSNPDLCGIRPGSIERDHVHMTSDLVWLVDQGPRPGLPDTQDEFIVDETKLSWMSIRQGIHHPKFRHWIWQLKGYCYAWETLRARLRCLFINGDYGPPRPLYHVYEIVFTYQEVIDCWAMLTGHARKRGMIP